MAMNYWDIDMVGIIAPKNYVAERKGESSKNIFINKQGQLQYIVKLISQPPENFPKVDLFTGYISNIEQYGFEDELNFDEDTREENFRNAIEDYFIVFNLRQKGDNYNIENVRLKRKIDAFDNLKDNLFIPIPFFQEKNEELGIDNFLEKVSKKQYVGKFKGLSTNEEDTPQIIIWGKNQFSDLYAIGNFRNHRYAFGGFQFEYDKIQYLKLKPEWLEFEFFADDTSQITFIENDAYEEIISELNKNGVDFKFESKNKVQVSDGVSIQSIDVNKTEMIMQSEKNEDNDSLDVNLIENFIQIARENNFVYDEKDMINFHVAMKTSNLVILSGMSGTGKSRLVQFYAKALGIQDDMQFKIIPVRPSWNDDSDLLGYVDSIHMIYKPGDSGLIDILIEASKEENIRDKIYIVCFDEMNLARVEHYFSQFLSVLEMESGKRCLRLYSEELEMKLYNSSTYKQKILIGDNIMFVGTVNIDESTYHFSDKVLDRANVINLRVKEDFLKFKLITQNNNDKNMKPKGKKSYYTYEMYDKCRVPDKQIDLTDRELMFFDEIHKKINQVNKNIGIGYRIIKQIDLYIKNLPPQEEMISKGEAIDLQLVQRVLTKIRGAEEQLKDLFNNDCEESLFLVLDKYKDISDFNESRNVLEQKKRELISYGYAL